MVPICGLLLGRVTALVFFPITLVALGESTRPHSLDHRPCSPSRFHRRINCLRLGLTPHHHDRFDRTGPADNANEATRVENPKENQPITLIAAPTFRSTCNARHGHRCRHLVKGARSRIESCAEPIMDPNDKLNTAKILGSTTLPEMSRTRHRSRCVSGI
jgi:hypothetical protein